MQIILILHNIRSTYNVGAILRTAEGLGINQLIFSGYTPRYNDSNLLPHLRAKLNRQIEKSALGAETLVPQGSTEDLPEFLDQKRSEGWKILGLENNLSPEEAKQRLILGQKSPLGDKIVLILGEEVAGIPSNIRLMVDNFLEIPMHGQKESFNVSVAAAIALWALLNLY